jgi:hypothetical protein
MKCPRRAEIGGVLLRADLPEADTWVRGTCSYCGSIAPDEFMRLAREGVELGPTDKNYKVYVGSERRKFYFQHLSFGQELEFIELYNTRTLKIGYPGHFYVLPFFCSRTLV